MSVAASAQWQWTDKDGRKVFSDRAPPADVLENNILKRPGARSALAAKTEAPSPATVAGDAVDAVLPAPQGVASTPKLTGIDKALAEKKKKAEEAEIAKRKAEDERVSSAKAENCARAKRAKASLDSGRRISQTNEKGEQEIMSDASRAAETKRIQAIVESDCN